MLHLLWNVHLILGCCNDVVARPSVTEHVFLAAFCKIIIRRAKNCSLVLASPCLRARKADYSAGVLSSARTCCTHFYSWRNSAVQKEQLTASGYSSIAPAKMRTQSSSHVIDACCTSKLLSARILKNAAKKLDRRLLTVSGSFSNLKCALI